MVNKITNCALSLQCIRDALAALTKVVEGKSGGLDHPAILLLTCILFSNIPIVFSCAAPSGTGRDTIVTYFTTTTKAKRPTTTEPIIGSLFYSGAAFGHYFAYFPGGGKLLRHQSSIVTSRITSCLDPLFAAGRVDAVDTKAVSNLNK